MISMTGALRVAVASQGIEVSNWLVWPWWIVVLVASAEPVVSLVLGLMNSYAWRAQSVRAV